MRIGSKSIKPIIAVCALLTFTSVSANEAESASTADSKVTTSISAVSYLHDWLSADGGQDQCLNGFALHRFVDISLSNRIPIYISTGVGVNFGFWSDSQSRNIAVSPGYLAKSLLKQKQTVISLAIPLNVKYSFKVNKISLIPYAGLNLKFNIFSQRKASLSMDSKDAQELVNSWDAAAFATNVGMPRTIDMFDAGDVGNDLKWRRFQLGWQIGVGMRFDTLYVGISYGTDFIKLADKVNSSTLRATLGFAI